MSLKFVGVGPVLVDYFVFCETLPTGVGLPEPGQKLRATDEDHMSRVRREWVDGWTPTVQVGGPVIVALRQAHALNTKARFAGAVGDDEMGQTITRDLAAAGFNTDDLVVQEGRRSGSAVAWIDADGDRSILFDAGDLEPLNQNRVESLFAPDVDLVHIDTREPVAATVLASWARERNIPVHYDVDPWEPHTPELLDLTTVAQVSHRALLTGWKADLSVKDAAIKLQKDHQLELAIVTNGPDGLAACTDNEVVEMSAYKVKSHDTIGTGDAFAGAFEVARRQGAGLREALAFGSAAGAVLSTILGNWRLPAESEIRGLMMSQPSLADIS